MDRHEIVDHLAQLEAQPGMAFAVTSFDEQDDLPLPEVLSTIGEKAQFPFRVTLHEMTGAVIVEHIAREAMQ